jgi:hypothetical protein
VEYVVGAETTERSHDEFPISFPIFPQTLVEPELERWLEGTSISSARLDIDHRLTLVAQKLKHR